jgi:hypothetical protein
MNIKLPPNIIVTSKYTSGDEYMFESTYNKYQGYYYELNGKLYAGKVFDSFAPILIKIQSKDINPALLNPATYLYATLSGANSTQSEPVPYYYDSSRPDNDAFRYFIQKRNVTPINIKEINKKTFEEFQLNPSYASVQLSYQNKFDQTEVEKAESNMPGIKTFVNFTYAPGVDD